MDLINEAKSKQTYYTEISSAEKIFVQQIAGIQAIKDAPGYKEIKLYRQREVEACVSRLSSTKKQELPIIQGELRSATKFLHFLEGLENEKS